MAISIFLFGLIVGSFLNVVILRFNTGSPIFYDRSRCFACGHVLAWYELIPLISFLIQKGRCRSCNAPLSWQYPIGEFLTGLVFVSLWSKIPSNFQFSIFNFQLLSFGIWYLVFGLLIVIAVYDFRTKIIPDRFVYPLIALGAVYAFINYYRLPAQNQAIDFAGYGLLIDGLAALSAAAFFALLWLVSQGTWIGFGDAKLTLGLGFFLGWPLILIALLIAFWSAAIAGIGLILFKGYTRKSEIPFGPFLAFGAFATFLVGEKILLWYGGIT